MAISLSEEYGSQATTPDTDYPNGTFKNKNGSQAGTPLEHTWARDKDGFFQKLLYDAGMDPVGSADTASSSQYLHALQYALSLNTRPPILDMSEICQEKFYGTYNGWTRPDKFPNVVTGLPSLTFRDACVGVNYSTSLPCLYVVMSNDTIYRVTGSLVYTSSPVANLLSLSFSGGTVESLRSVCCDGEKLYVLWRSTDDEYHVTCFYMASPGTYPQQWDKNLAMDYSGDEEYSKIIISSSTTLAVSSDNQSGTCGVAIVPRSGTGTVLKGTGAGGPSGTSIPAGGRLTTDGDHVFWIHRDVGASEAFICSASIDDPTTSDYTYQSITQDSDLRTLPVALYNYGGSSSGTVALVPAAPSVDYIKMFVKSDDSVQSVTTLTQLPASDTVDYTACMGFDGMNFWLRLNLVDQLSTSNCLAFCKIPATQFVDALTYPYEHDVSYSTVITSNAADKTVDYEPGRMLFDGADMWYVSRNGFIYRIANPGAR